MQLKRLVITLFGGFLIFFTSCYSELNDLEFGRLEWSPELAVPLVNSTFTFADLLKEADPDLLYSEEDGRMVLIFKEDSLFSSKATDFYGLANKDFPTLPILLTPEEVSTFNTTGSVNVTRSAEIEYTSNLDSILLHSGLAELRLEENFPANGNFSISISTEATGSANPDILAHSYSWTYDGLSPVSSDTHTNAFNDVRFSFVGSNPTNLLRVTYQLALQQVNNNTLSFGENSMRLDLAFKEQDFRGLYGDLGTQDISTDKNIIDTDIFNSLGEFENINYYLAAPRFSVSYKNSLGVPILFQVESFQYFKDGNAIAVNYDADIHVPQAEINQPALTTVSFDSQIKEVVNNQPDSMEFSIGGILDPTDTPNNFVTDDAEIQVGYLLEVPLELSLSGVSIDENLPLEDIDPKNTGYAILSITTLNEIPLDVSLQADALSEDGTRLKTLFEGLILQASSGSELAPYEAVIELRDNPQTAENELNFLKETKSIQLIGALATPENGKEVVKISSEASISVAISVQAKYTLTDN